MIRNRILFYVLLALFTACDYQSFTATELEEPKVAVSSFFSPDSVIRVKVTPVVDAFTDSSETLDVKEVKVTNLKTGKVVYLEKEEGSESVYTSAQLIPALGDVFKLEAQTNASDEPIVAVDSISAMVVPFQIADTWVVVTDKSSGNNTTVGIRRNVNIRFMPVNDEEPVYLELLAFVTEYADFSSMNESSERQSALKTSTSFITLEDYYPSVTAMDAVYPHSLLFKCPVSDDSLTVNFSYSTGMSFSSDGISSNAHDLRIELRQVSFAYYKYMTALLKQENALMGDILYGGAPPVMIPTNIENGTGVFAGYNSTEYKTYIDEYIYQRNH